MNLDEILLWAQTEFELEAGQTVQLRDRLLAREDQITGVFFIAAQQFGMFPAIVAEVIAEAGLGTPPTEEERQIIRQNFTQLMEEIERQWRAQGTDGP